MRIPPLKAIIAFESIARTKSVNRAAEELDLTASAVSHQLSNLESMIGQSLFQRTGRGLVLTPTGRALSGGCHGVAGRSQPGNRASFESERSRNPARAFEPEFRAHVAVAATILVSGSKRRYPVERRLFVRERIVFERLLRHRHSSWLWRMERPGGRTVRGEFIAPLASPEYLKRNPVNSPEDLLAQRLVYSETPLVQWRQWFGRAGVCCGEQDIRFFIRPLLHVALKRPRWG